MATDNPLSEYLAALRATDRQHRTGEGQQAQAALYNEVASSHPTRPPARPAHNGGHDSQYLDIPPQIHNKPGDSRQIVWSGNEPRRQRDNHLEDRPPMTTRTADGEVTELYHLKYSTARHSTPDALVYVPRGFDPHKPIRVMVYNHGLDTDAKEAFNVSKLKNQMANGDPNTVLIVPEWQTRTQSRESGDRDRFHDAGFFRNQLNEIFSKTPALQGKRAEDVASFGLITHSGGYKATMSEMYRNGIYNKVTSLTVLDSMYDPKGYDKWISDNIRDLANGRKHLLVVYTDHLSPHSNGLAQRMEQMLKHEGISKSVIQRDTTHPQSVTSDSTLRDHGIVFKYSTLKTGGQSAHGTMTGYYVKEVVASEAGNRAGNDQYAELTPPPWRPLPQEFRFASR